MEEELNHEADDDQEDEPVKGKMSWSLFLSVGVEWLYCDSCHSRWIENEENLLWNGELAGNTNVDVIRKSFTFRVLIFWWRIE